MLLLAVAALLVSAAICYAVGYAFIAPRDSILRTKRGITFLVVGVLSFVTLPPQLPTLGSATAALPDSFGDLGLGWPASLSPGTYNALWLVTSLSAVLVGMQVWRAGRPGWRSGSGGAAYDSSAAGRAAALIAVADNIDDVFDALRRTGADAKGVDRIADVLRIAGQRLASGLPADAGSTYRLAVSKLNPTVATGATRYLLEGAGRASQIANTTRK